MPSGDSSEGDGSSASTSSGVSTPLAVVVGSLQSFQVKGDSHSVSQRWRKWKRAFQLYVLGKGITNDWQKRGLLLHTAGLDVQEVYFTLVPDGAEKNYAETFKALDGYFIPKANVPFERHLFRLRAASCEFGEREDEYITDQLIGKCYSAKFRRKFLEKERSVTLNDLLVTARAQEAVSLQMEAMGANSGSGQVNTVVDDGATGGHISSEQVNIVVSLRGSTSSEKRDCFNCGREDHLARDWRCPARGRKCLQCGEIGHFKVKCCKKLAKNSHLGHRQGATCNLLGQGAWEWFKSQKIQFQTRKEAKALFPYGSTKPLSTLGTFTADIMSIDTSVTCKADFVVINGDGRSLLCRETTVKLGLLRPGPSHAVNVVNTEADIKEKYKELFSGVGLLRDYELKLNIDDSVKPVAQRVRRIPFGVREKVERKLDELLENGIIEEVPEGPTGWVSPLVVIPKADGDIRICVDMRCANQAIVRERQPIPTIEEVLQDLYGSTVFSRVDLRWGFYQILLAEESRHVTKFVTHRGLYRYTRLMFGVTSAPEKYQQIIRDVLRGCEGVANIADDLIIHGRGEEQHDKRLLAVLDRLRETGLTLNKDKCEFILPRLKFFGLEVTQTGIEPSEEKVAEIRQAGPPQNVSEARSFHGLAQFVSKFVPDLSSIAERIQRLTHKNAEFKWGKEQ
ncbi:uncharacterized protein LOC111328046 [Stylophora pistillata]|uniref:uncharacterized protein LOC111328046 n=1 Tax=Stylophora pistillata TaxID=50429 RepID=UPI000C039128|nr:uncharacterized protein LOC111328046 [Stylophora pistillata]